MGGTTIKANNDFEMIGSTEGEIKPPKSGATNTIAEGIEGTVINTSYSSIGYKMLKSMKALKYNTQQHANAKSDSYPRHNSKDEGDGDDDGEDDPESQFLIGHAKAKKMDDDPQLYYVRFTLSKLRRAVQ